MAKCKYCLKELGTDGFCSNCRPGKLKKSLVSLKVKLRRIDNVHKITRC